MPDIKSLTTRTSQRYGTAQQWIDRNPILLEGEIGIESDTTRVKVVNGVDVWIDLPYWVNGDLTYTAGNGVNIANHVISTNLLYDVIE